MSNARERHTHNPYYIQCNKFSKRSELILKESGKTDLEVLFQ